MLDDAEHTWDEGVITKEPTTDAEGEKTFTCDVCKATMTKFMMAQTTHSIQMLLTKIRIMAQQVNRITTRLQ